MSCRDTRAFTTVIFPHIFQQSYNGFQKSRGYCPDTRAFPIVKHRLIPCVFRQSNNGCQFSIATITEWYGGFLCSCRGHYVSGKEPASFSLVYFLHYPARIFHCTVCNPEGPVQPVNSPLLTTQLPSYSPSLSLTNNPISLYLLKS